MKLPVNDTIAIRSVHLIAQEIYLSYFNRQNKEEREKQLTKVYFQAKHSSLKASRKKSNFNANVSFDIYKIVDDDHAVTVTVGNGKMVLLRVP